MMAKYIRLDRDCADMCRLPATLAIRESQSQLNFVSYALKPAGPALMSAASMTRIIAKTAHKACIACAEACEKMAA